MSRLTDERIAALSIIKTLSAAHVDHGTLVDVRAMADELRERRSHDHNLIRLANELRGYYKRFDGYPRRETGALLDAVDALLEGRER